MLDPDYIDIHIHTSENPNSLNEHYDVRKLYGEIEKNAQGAESIIALTDHNVINKKAYLDAEALGNAKVHLVLGVELHINNFQNAPAYHCHMLINSPINEPVIDDINLKLQELYPNKVVEKKDNGIPTIEMIMNLFDEYDFMLLPHGGQSHSTFDKSIPPGTKFDTTMQRSIYYNQFEGYTARSKDGLETTIDYFRRLGINEFINLVTCSDNYNPSLYPQAKAGDASPFIPTWMFATPDFSGLRLSLSESSRLHYSIEKPSNWSESIKKVYLKDDNILIDVTLTPGLNVIIGGSSSGKTLLVDSIDRKISGKSFDDSYYLSYHVQNIDVVNPSNLHPHYLNQNYIMKVVNTDTAARIEDIDVVKRLFPIDEEFSKKVELTMMGFRQDVSRLIKCVEKIQEIEKKLEGISHVGALFTLNKVAKNIIEPIMPSQEDRRLIKYDENIYNRHVLSLNEIRSVLQNNPFSTLEPSMLDDILSELGKLRHIAQIEDRVSTVISEAHNSYNDELRNANLEDQTKNQQLLRLLDLVKEYVINYRTFSVLLDKIAQYHMEESSREVISMGHHLFVQNNFSLSKEKILDSFNCFLKNPIQRFESLEPGTLFSQNHKQRPKVASYDDLIDKVYDKLIEDNKTIYRITTNEGKDFDSLSAGWRTSVLLDLIFGYADDIAPVIIDQPEDNLATNYINDGLVRAIKEVKTRKQIILVSHNATIPMMADAQNIVYCKNDGNRITIKSAPLEGSIDGKTVLDLVAAITDGGKSSIKKRVKKYNLKKYC